MHDIRSLHVRIAFVWNVNGCLGVIACAFKWGVTLVGKFNYWHCSPRRRKYFKALKVHRGTERIQDLSDEGKARFGLVLYFVNVGWKTQSL